MLAVGIITAPRQTPTIETMLASYWQCFDVKPWIFAEPGSHRPWHEHRWMPSDIKKGNGLNWLQALGTLLVATNEPYVMICEDDIEFHTMAPIRIRQQMLAGTINAFSPYCSLVNRREAAEPGWVVARIDKAGWCGNMCMVIPRELGCKIVQSQESFLRYSKGIDGTDPDYYHADYALGKVITDLDYTIIAHQPTLVLHLDGPSTNEYNNRDPKWRRTSKARLPAL